MCARLASEYHQLNFVVQDLAPVLEGVEDSIQLELKSRIQFMPLDFIKDVQPVKNADVYFFRWIFHDWSEKYSKILLRNLIPALKPGAHIVVMDNVLPLPGVLPNWQEERLRSMDLTMLEMQNSQERELNDWKNLFESVDNRFKWKNAHLPDGSRLWILEVVWEP